MSTRPCRALVIEEIAEAIARLHCAHPIRVAIDGVGAAGKTILADELAQSIERAGRPVIRAGVDGFHNSRKIRYARGPTSPEGYYRDSFDYDAITRHLLVPLGPDGNLLCRTAIYDFRTESRVEEPEFSADLDAVLLFDGVFILCPELRERWDFAMFIDASFEVTMSRALTRDVELFGSPVAVRARYEARYIPGERLCLREVRPQEHADVIVRNDDPLRPTIEWVAGGGRRGE